MDLLDRLLGHDAWTTGLLLQRTAEVSVESLDTEFDIGVRSVRASFDHVIYNMEAWSDELARRPIRPRPDSPPPEACVSTWQRRLVAAAEQLATAARTAHRDRTLDEMLTDPSRQPPERYTRGSVIAHVITHSMHHRAEILHMLERLGLRDLPEGDVIRWERATRSTA